jgi:RNA polymerase sigma-70 factor (ECF subfamily)
MTTIAHRGCSTRSSCPNYRYMHSARGELLRRLARTAEAREEYGRAAALSDDAAERRLFERRLAAI